jgi:hypothetical protein
MMCFESGQITGSFVKAQRVRDEFHNQPAMTFAEADNMTVFESKYLMVTRLVE